MLCRGLNKGVVVGLSFATAPHIVHNGARNATARVVAIHLGVPLSARLAAIHVALETHGPDVAIMAHGSGVVGSGAIGRNTMIAKRVTAAGAEPAHTERRAHAMAEALLVKGVQAPLVARPILCLNLYMALDACSKLWSTRANVDRTRIGKVGGRLKDGALLPIEEAYLLNIVERELAEVYLLVLRVAQLNAIIKDA